jgi:hypothetical protein
VRSGVFVTASVTRDGSPPVLVGWQTMTTERIADHVKFAYWVPNVSGGLVTSDIEQRTDWNYEYNVKLAQTAENNGFEYALSQVRYEASYGAEYQHESTSFSLALLLATQKLKVTPRSTRAYGSRPCSHQNPGRREREPGPLADQRLRIRMRVRVAYEAATVVS